MEARNSPSPVEFDDKKDQTTDVHMQETSADPESGAMTDAVFGDLSGKGPKYRNLGWVRASVLLIKTQIGLGVLAIPYVLHTLGIVPGVLVILAIAILTTWSDYVVGTFKLNHPEVYSLADVGQLILGPVGREFLGFTYWLTLTAIAGAGLLGTSISLNAVSDHGACTVVFVVVAAIIVILISSIQTLDRISFIAWIGLASIIGSVITLAIAVSLQDRPSAAPATGPIDLDIRIFGDTSFIDAISAVSVVVFSYAGTPAFFNIVAEIRDPKDYPKALAVCQSVVTAVYLVIGGVVYHYCGQYVASPALGSAGPLLKKVCYGIAMPGLLVGAVIYTHTPAKYIFIRVLRGSKHLSANTITHRVVWLSCVIGNCTISFLIAMGIPFFGNLVSLVGALLGTLLSMQTMGVMWIFDNHYKERTTAWKLLYAWNVFLITVGTFLMVAGTYASVITIKQQLDDGDTTSPFSCADNSA